MKRILTAIIAALALTAGAEPATSGPLSITATSQTVTFAARRSGVSITNNSTSANELYFRLFTNCDTAAAATTAYIELKPGESIGFIFNAQTECDWWNVQNQTTKDAECTKIGAPTGCSICP